MMLAVYRCDHCGEETDPLSLDVLPPFIKMSEPCPAHGSHDYDYCSLDCAMRGVAAHLDHVEAHETD